LRYFFEAPEAVTSVTMRRSDAEQNSKIIREVRRPCLSRNDYWSTISVSRRKTAPEIGSERYSRPPVLLLCPVSGRARQGLVLLENGFKNLGF